MMEFSNHELVLLIKDNLSRVSFRSSEYGSHEAARLSELALELQARIKANTVASERSLREWDKDFRSAEQAN